MVFVEDGTNVQTCKSFRYNIDELIRKYEAQLDAGLVVATEKFIEMREGFDKRAYRELLELCQKHLNPNAPTF